MTTMGVKLDEETCARLKSLGAIKRRSAHWLMKEAILEYLDKQEAIEARNRDADEAWREYQSTGQFVSNDAMTAWFDAWGTDSEGPPPENECLP